MENIFLLKIEVFVFIVSLLYILYYIGEKTFLTYFKLKKIVVPKKTKDYKKIRKNNILNDEKKDNIDDIKWKKHNKKHNKKSKNKIKCLLTEDDKIKILEILKKVKINSLKWYFEKSKLLIIEWLTIDKYNKDLNLELASIYEIENNYKNAELIYTDLLGVYKNDSELWKKLAFNLAMQNKLKKSFEVYQEVLKKRRNDIEIIEMLTDISYDLKDFVRCLKYVNLYLKDKSRDVDKLFIKWYCLEKLKKFSEAELIYKKILDLQPYNTDARDRLRKLQK